MCSWNRLPKNRLIGPSKCGLEEELPFVYVGFLMSKFSFQLCSVIEHIPLFDVA